MALIGIVMIVWGIRHMRRGLKDLQHISDELSDLGEESDEETID